jgi:hypothetical protein
MRYGPLLVWAIVACGSRPSEQRFAVDTPPGRSLVGAWNAKLSLARPYPLEPNDPAATRICGTIGFVENHYANVAANPAGTPQVGVYDLDLSALGLNWLDRNVFPAAVVSAVRPDATGATTANDTVAIVLNPGSPERIILLGRYDVRGIDGQWTAQSSRGTAAGSFSLRRRDNPDDHSPAC